MAAVTRGEKGQIESSHHGILNVFDSSIMKSISLFSGGFPELNSVAHGENFVSKVS